MANGNKDNIFVVHQNDKNISVLLSFIIKINMTWA